MVSTNDPQHPLEKLVCKGKLLDPLRITPEFINFGRVPEDAPSQRAVSIVRGDGPPIAPKVAPTSTQGLSAAIKEITPGERYDLVFTLTPPLKPGRLSTSVQLQTGVPQAPTANVSVFAVVAPQRVAGPTPGSSPADQKANAPTRSRQDPSRPGS